MFRRDTFDLHAIAPPAAPCFSSQRQWLLYLDETLRNPPRSQGRPVQLVEVDSEGKPHLNEAWNMCKDCAYRRAERAAMASKGTCQPDWWARHAKAINAGQPLPTPEA
jgi:hypothetical protein